MSSTPPISPNDPNNQSKPAEQKKSNENNPTVRKVRSKSAEIYKPGNPENKPTRLEKSSGETPTSRKVRSKSADIIGTKRDPNAKTISLLEECKQERLAKLKALPEDDQNLIGALSRELTELGKLGMKHADERLIMNDLYYAIPASEGSYENESFKSTSSETDIRKEKLPESLEDRILPSEITYGDELFMDNTSGSDTGEEKLSERQIQILEEKIRQHTEIFTDLEKSMEAMCTKLTTTYSKCAVTKDCLSGFFTLNQASDPKLLVRVLQEQSLNLSVNRLHFISSVRNTINKNKAAIVNLFNKKDGPTDLEEIKVVVVSPELNLYNAGETHNRGRIPCEVIFQTNLGAELFKVFYKPRAAEIDIEVVEVFKKLNTLDKSQRSLTEDLPEYKIMSLGEDEGSIWEFIDGVQFKDIEVDAVISNKILDFKVKEILERKLLRLLSICRNMNISDLHWQNIIFKNLFTSNPEIVPIDLESIQKCAVTGLYRKDEPETPELKAQEKEIIAKFVSSIPTMPFRMVLVKTVELKGLLNNPILFELILAPMIVAAKSLGYKFLDVEKLGYLICKDGINNDIPYLTEYQDELYYGLGKDKKLIGTGKRKGEE